MIWHRCRRCRRRLRNIDNVSHNYDVIGIDEAIFNDIAHYCEKWAQTGKTVIARLDATFQRKPFNSILQLVPLAEKVTKLTAVCTDCAADATFTARTTKEADVIIGGSSTYKAVCRNCYEKYAAEMRENGASAKTAVGTPLTKRVAEHMGELSLKRRSDRDFITFATPATPTQ